VDRLPLLLMIVCSISFGIFPGHFYSVIRSGVDPLIARITQVVPLAAEPGEESHQLSAVSSQLQP
jgi:NADH-quinone oxidoreductase subunit M